MKMAKATEQDMDTALLVARFLDILDDCNHPLRRPDFPPGVDGKPIETDPDYFDKDDEIECKTFLRRLVKVLDKSPGCMNRVIWGFHTVLHNDVFDHDADTLEFHPTLIDAVNARAKKAEPEPSHA
jgi:hypothetical protein